MVGPRYLTSFPTRLTDVLKGAVAVVDCASHTSNGFGVGVYSSDDAICFSNKSTLESLYLLVSNLVTVDTNLVRYLWKQRADAKPDRKATI